MVKRILILLLVFVLLAASASADMLTDLFGSFEGCEIIRVSGYTAVTMTTDLATLPDYSVSPIFMDIEGMPLMSMVVKGKDNEPPAYVMIETDSTKYSFACSDTINYQFGYSREEIDEKIVNAGHQFIFLDVDYHDMFKDIGQSEQCTIRFGRDPEYQNSVSVEWTDEMKEICGAMYVAYCSLFNSLSETDENNLIIETYMAAIMSAEATREAKVPAVN